MRELNIEQRLTDIEENVFAIRRMLEELLSKQTTQPIADDNEIMSVKQVAQFLGLDTNLIYARCAKGDIPYFKIGKHYRFKKVDVRKWLKGQKEQSDFSVDDYVEKYLQQHVLKA
jgi:excisionase family DNA binding protein